MVSQTVEEQPKLNAVNQAGETDVEPDVHVPPIVSWLLTGQCNMRCLHCYPGSEPHYTGDELTVEQQFSAVQKLYDAGVESVFLSGGEVLILPHIFELIDALHEHNIGTWICSNGSLINEDKADQIAVAGILGVSVSLDSSDADTHDEFRVHPGSHSRALRAIGLLRERDVTVDMDCTATKLNAKDVQNIYALAGDLGVKSLFLKRFRPLGRGSENLDRLAPSLSDYKQVVDDLLGEYRRYDTEVCFEDPSVHAYRRHLGKWSADTSSLYSKFGCFAGIVWMGIQANGDITPCPLLNVPIGNVVHDDIIDVVGRSKVMRRMLDRDDRSGKCGSCDERWQCGGCRAHAYAASGDVFGEDPFCIYSDFEGGQP